MNSRIILWTAVLVFLLGCENPGSGRTRFSREQLYRLHCSGCHGDGTGNGHIAGTLPIRPRNLRHSEWQKSVTDEHIYQVIREGGKSVKLNEAMPAFKEKLSDAEIKQLVGYLRFLGR
jgi:mono/diheme cytochrome c family protein